MNLNPCYCGGPAAIKLCEGGSLFFVACTKCPLQLGNDLRGWKSQASAIASWNETFPLPKAEVLPEKTAAA